MSDKLEQLKNIIIMVIEYNNLVIFGSEKHFYILSLFENIKSIKEIKEIDNDIVKKAIDYISKNDKLLNILENDIKVKITDLKATN